MIKEYGSQHYNSDNYINSYNFTVIATQNCKQTHISPIGSSEIDTGTYSRKSASTM